MRRWYCESGRVGSAEGQVAGTHEDPAIRVSFMENKFNNFITMRKNKILIGM